MNIYEYIQNNTGLDDRVERNSRKIKEQEDRIVDRLKDLRKS